MIRRMVPRELTDSVRLPCGQVLAGRLIKTAMSEQLADRRNAPTIAHQRLFRRWGKSGVGLMVSGNISVHRGHLSEPRNVVVEDHRDLPALRDWAAAAKQHGARMWLQINHPGRQAMPAAGGNRPVAPSPVEAKFPGSKEPRELGSDEIEEIVQRFAVAATVAKEAGFDGVQLHGCHGMLISQFLSPLTNRRDDRWGGDPWRRMRFVLEVLRAVRAAVGRGPDFAVGIKLNSADFQRGGFTEDDCEIVVERLVAEGIDLIEISGGNIETLAFVDGGKLANTKEREAYFLGFAERVSRKTGGVPLGVTGGFRSLAAMRSAVADGACDLVGIGRPFCTMPDAIGDLLRGDQQRVYDGDIHVSPSSILAKFLGPRLAVAALDTNWHTDQIHRLAAGKDPDLKRALWRTAISSFRRYGVGAARRKRKEAGPTSSRQ
jgi:2,4-dienoyl-CoA reductase-like NADH-dependent reductase (Old Yellow Enzyme family)